MKEERLEKMLIVVAIADTMSEENGTKIKHSRTVKYVEITRTIHKKNTKNSNFRVGIYGETWANNVK